MFSDITNFFHISIILSSFWDIRYYFILTEIRNEFFDLRATTNTINNPLTQQNFIVYQFTCVDIQKTLVSRDFGPYALNVRTNISSYWLSATGGQGTSPKTTFSPLKFSKTIERTIAYCFKNNGLLSSPQKNFF